jgi:hypothetical protein
MIDGIFAGMANRYKQGGFKEKTVFYFAIDEVKKTLTFHPDSCIVEDGKTVENADCFCKTNSELFLKIVQNGYQPGIKDFVSGQIKSNAPFLLLQFMGAFTKE